MTNTILMLSSQPWIARLALALMHFVWQGALIAGLYAAARSWFSRTRSTGFRYLLSCATLAAMAIAPIVTFCISDSALPSRSAVGVVGTLVSPTLTPRATWFAPVTTATLRTWTGSATTWIVLIWFAGAIAFCARLAGGWVVASRIRSLLARPAPREWQQHLDRLRIRVRLSQPVRLVVSSLVQVPTVVGWLKPIVLVPMGALTGLEPELIEAFLAHELAHIRRHDYLVNVLQGVVEAILFYHPAVWWVSREIRRERELCCDDIAVSTCGNPLTYVRALTELEQYRPVHLNPALAANGGSLSGRVARLLGVSLPPARIAAPGPAPVVIAILIAAGLVFATRSNAQISIVAASSLPAFDVASIKPSDPDSQLKIDFAAGGRLFVTHATLRFLIKIAYDISDDQIVGGPAWFSSKRFDVQGKPSTPVPGDPQTMDKDQVLVFHAPTRLRLQRLLADRFQLELRKESKDMPIFALVPGKNGPDAKKLKRSSTTGNPELTFAHGILQAKRVDMPTLARFLSEGQAGRPVVDMSGLSGKFDFRLEWSPDPNLDPLSAGTQADTGGVSIFTALQQQLGMKLDARTSPADAVVVARAELPSAD